MKGLYDNYDAVKDVPVTRFTTAFTDENGAKHILIINKALFFGSTMDHSLINPNQI